MSGPSDLSEIFASQRAAEEFIAETGGLPEITRASADFLAAIDQTDEEIAAAVFAERFRRTTGNHFMAMASGAKLSPRTQQLVEEEGEAGIKRSELEHELRSIAVNFSSLAGRLVRLRCDLIVSQMEDL